MKAAEFIYHRPRELPNALQLLGELGENVKVLSGGQSLLPIMNMRLAEPAHLVDVTRIEMLRGATESGGRVCYGAATTHQMVEDGLVPDAGGGLLTRAAAGIGYRAIRNRGTMGGSLAHADPSAEWPTVLSALDATAEARSARGVRSIPVRQLLQGFFSTSLAPDELIVTIEVRRLAPGRWLSIHKTARRPGEFADSLAVVLFDEDGSGSLHNLEFWLGAARDVPIRLAATERLVTGRRRDELDVGALAPAVAVDIGAGDGPTDLAARHALQLHAATVCRALASAERATFDE